METEYEICSNNEWREVSRGNLMEKILHDEYKAEVEQWGYIDPVRWNAFYNWVNEHGLSVTNIPENTGFNNSYLE